MNNLLERFAGWLRRRGCARMIRLTELMSGTEYDYLERFYLLNWERIGIFLHRFHAPDPDRIHDHPWANVTVVLLGGYIEEFHDGTNRVRLAGDLVYRQALTLHRIGYVLPGTWTLFFRFRKSREWGELTETGRWNRVGGNYEVKTRGLLFPRVTVEARSPCAAIDADEQQHSPRGPTGPRGLAEAGPFGRMDEEAMR